MSTKTAKRRTFESNMGTSKVDLRVVNSTIVTLISGGSATNTKVFHTSGILLYALRNARLYPMITTTTV